MTDFKVFLLALLTFVAMYVVGSGIVIIAKSIGHLFGMC